MKKISILLLVMAMIFGMMGCSDSGTAAETTEGTGENYEGLMVGFGYKEITPKGYEVHIAGGDWASRTTKGFRDELRTTCVAISQGGETLLMFTMDFLGSKEKFVDPAKKMISEATGVPEENIWMNATHTHAGVGIAYDWKNGNIGTYRDAFNKACTQAAEKAMEDRAPAEMYYGGIATEGMAFVRHYEMNDGTIGGANFGDFSSGIKGHTSEADNELQLVNFVREGDKKDVLLMSFPAHCTMNQSSTELSADYPAPAREYLEENGDYLVAFFQGASGDQVPSSRIPGEEFSADYKVYGEKLAQYALDAIPTLTKCDNPQLKISTKVYTGKSNKEGIERLADARAVQAVIDQYSKSSSEAKAAAQQYGFSSVYEAGAVITRANLPETQSMELRTFSLGDVGFVVAPYEMFSQHSMQIKEKSPFAETFMVTLGQGDIGYLPTVAAAEYGSYEACVSVFERGTGDKMVDEFLAMLTDMKGA